jgi:uncharacterized membrane protein YeaQ/YmgE (transglycosylase-associated protein family)
VLKVYQEVCVSAFDRFIIDLRIETIYSGGNRCTIFYFYYLLIVGLIAGWLAGKIMKGKGFGLVGDLIVGVVGAVIGGWVFGLLGFAAYGLIGSIIVALIGALILLYILRLIKK